MQVKVRFAPSPTGALHIGSARTALFNWLFARHHGGKLALRIEDTDLARSKKESVDAILDALQWLGMDWDEGPILQSSRLARYQEVAGQLVARKIAEHREGAVVMPIPHDRYVFQDLVRGKVEFDRTKLKDPSSLMDLVLIKSDGTPTYNFAVVVDDSEMNITHVIRGEDILSNTPKQLAVYEALGRTPPQWAHLPMILDESGSKMSKRTGATSIQEFRNEGYAPEAMLNYIALLGWSPGGDREVMSREELIRLFTLERVGRANARFNADKLYWLNGQHLVRMPLDRFVELARPFLERAGIAAPIESLRAALALVQPKIKSLADVPAWTACFFRDDFRFEEAAAAKLRETGTAETLKMLAARLETVAPFDSAHIETAVKSLAKETQSSSGRFIHPCRAAVTGRTVGAGLYETLALLGKERVRARLQRAVEMCGSRK